MRPIGPSGAAVHPIVVVHGSVAFCEREPYGGVDADILNPRNIWTDPAEWDATDIELAKKFIANFEAFVDTDATRALIAAGPQL